MGDRVTVDITIASKDAERFDKFLEKAWRQPDGFLHDDDGFSYYALCEVNYGNVDFLQDMEEPMAYDARWQAGAEFGSGCQYSRIDAYGKHTVKDLYDDETGVSFNRLVEANEEGKVKELIESERDRLYVMSWEDQIKILEKLQKQEEKIVNYKVYLSESGRVSNTVVKADSIEAAKAIVEKKTKAEIVGVIREEADVTSSEASEPMYYEDTTQDWRIGAGNIEVVPVEHKDSYKRVVQVSNTGGLYVDLSKKSDEDEEGLGDDLSVAVEVRNGQPAISVGCGDELYIHLERTELGYFIHTDGNTSVHRAKWKSSCHNDLEFEGYHYEI